MRFHSPLRAVSLRELALFSLALVLCVLPASCGGGGGGGGGTGFVGPVVIVSTTGPTLTTPASPTLAMSTTVTGVALRDGSSIRIEGGAQPVQMPTNADRSFSITVNLRPNAINRLHVTEFFITGAVSPVIVLEVIQDQSAPSIFIDFPPEGAELTSSTTDVAGRISDPLNGSDGLTVTVNGIPATVDSGLGAQGSFSVQNVPLTSGTLTLIDAVVTDLVGNTSNGAVTVSWVDIAPEESFITASQGNNQVGTVETMLPNPLSVQLFRGDGTPFAGKVVTFQVDRSNGRLSGGAPGGTPRFRTLTDAAGIAEAFWTLGSDAGPGNNRVSVRSADVVGTVYFCANASPGPPIQINVGSGDGQFVASKGPLGEKLKAWVSDSKNGVGGIPVTFTVVQGGGLVDGVVTKTVATDSSGHAEVSMVVGDAPGKNIVSATFPGGKQEATFVAESARLNAATPTSLEGVVFNGGFVPIGGAACTLVVDGVTIATENTDASGQFLFADAMSSGLASLRVDGSVATSLGGGAVGSGGFPALVYEFFLIPNARNRLPARISLPDLDSVNEVVFDGSAETVLTVNGIEDFSITVAAGSVTLADGTSPSASMPITLSLNPVKPGDLPGPLPNGGAPNFAWILEPAGLQFDPPATIRYPNLAGLPAGTITQFFEFNSSVNRFDSIGTGQVAEDGSVVTPDIGVGLLRSGIGTSLPPYARTVDCKNCNILVTGPETAVTDQTVTFMGRAVGPGTVTWRVLDNTTVNENVVSLGMDATGAINSLFSFTFTEPGSAAAPGMPGIAVEATLTCPDGVIDRHLFGVTVTTN